MHSVSQESLRFNHGKHENRVSQSTAEPILAKQPTWVGFRFLMPDKSSLWLAKWRMCPSRDTFSLCCQIRYLQVNFIWKPLVYHPWPDTFPDTALHENFPCIKVSHMICHWQSMDCAEAFNIKTQPSFPPVRLTDNGCAKTRISVFQVEGTPVSSTSQMTTWNLRTQQLQTKTNTGCPSVTWHVISLLCIPRGESKCREQLLGRCESVLFPVWALTKLSKETTQV